MTHQDGRDIDAGLVIQEGRWYRDRKGRVHGEMRLGCLENYPFWVPFTGHWGLFGKDAGGNPDFDLIAEVPAPLRARTDSANGEG